MVNAWEGVHENFTCGELEPEIRDGAAEDGRLPRDAERAQVAEPRL